MKMALPICTMYSKKETVGSEGKTTGQSHSPGSHSNWARGLGKRPTLPNLERPERPKIHVVRSDVHITRCSFPLAPTTLIRWVLCLIILGQGIASAKEAKRMAKKIEEKNVFERVLSKETMFRV